MSKNRDEEGAPSPDPLDREISLTAFEKLEKAIQLIDEALKERPNLKSLQVEPLLRSLSKGLVLLSSKDSDLDLSGLMVKYGWYVGQRFFVRVRVVIDPVCSFVVLAGQDIAEGIVIPSTSRRVDLLDGEQVAVDLEISRGVHRVSWRVRAIDRE